MYFLYNQRQPLYDIILSIYVVNYTLILNKPNAYFWKLMLFLMLIAAPVLLNATHLVGGSMSYEYVGKNNNGTFRYKITLKIYRDCQTSSTQFDQNIELGAYEEGLGTLSLNNSFMFSLVSEVDVSPPKASSCSDAPTVCIKEATYTKNIDLPASSSGFHLVFVRCCRNSQTNLADSTGQTYYAYIPPSSTVNSSPYFSGVPAPYICVGDTTTFLNGAVDPDGDSLSYQLVQPWSGADGFNPIPGASPTLSLPIGTAKYRNNYSQFAPFGSGGIASIEPTTGLTTMRSPAQGLYSIAVEVTEWRNGVKLSTIRRDVQIIAIKCPPNQIPSVYPNNGVYNLVVTAGDKVCFDITATDADNPGQLVTISARGEVFGTDPGWQGPVATFKRDSAIQTVASQFCWQTQCTQGRAAPYTFVVDAIDNGCPPKSRSISFSVEVKKYPGQISFGGPSKVCEDDTGVVYRTPNTVGSKYKWEISGGTIVGPDSLNSVKVNWAGIGFGKLKITETNSVGCTSPQYEYVVEKGGYPNPIIITPDTVCEFTSKQYAIAPTAGSKYNWVVFGGAITSQPKIYQANINWASMGSGTINIIETNLYGCVSDTNKGLIDITRPLSDSIYGSQSVCPHIRGVNYSAYPPREGSIYKWDIQGGTIVAGDSTKEITVNWGPAGVGRVRFVETVKWGCTGDTVSINVVINHVLQGFKPFGKDTLCEFTPAIPYSVVKTTGSKYFWDIIGGTITQDDTTNNIIANWGSFGNAAVSVYEISYDSINNIPCIGKPVILDVYLAPIPTATIISGRNKVCEDEKNILHTISGFTGSTYKWMLDGDSLGFMGQGTNTMAFDATKVGTFNINVVETSTFGCIGKPTDTVVRVTPKPRTQPIAGDSIVCFPNFSPVVYSTQGNQGSAFHWFMDGATIDSGNQTSLIYTSFTGQKFNFLKVVEITDEGCIGDTLYKNIFADRPYLKIRYVSVGFPDNFMRIAWQLDSAPFYNYDFTIQRKTAGKDASTNSWRNVGKVNGNTFSYIDTNLNTDDNAYEYRIRGINLCGGEFFSPIHTNILLKGEQDDEYDVRLTWSPYKGWSDGVGSYEIFRRNDFNPLHVFSKSIGTDTVAIYTDAFNNFIHRYRIRAWENTIASDTSWSNELELVLIPVIWIPNAFTPNTDGLNPKFEIISGSIKTFEMHIFDRWGAKVFATDTISNYWDGTINGNPAPDGVYLYQMRYTGGNNKINIRSGNITLLR
jgi:gliding motility-associated-like protein